MQAHDREIDVVEQFMVELSTDAGAGKHHHLLSTITLQKREQQQQALI